jgi:hypothetical protein
MKVSTAGACRASLDYWGLIEIARHGLDVKAVHVYDATTPGKGPTGSSLHVRNVLQSHPLVRYHVRMSLEPPRYEQKEVDVDLATDLLIEAVRNPTHQIVLVTGDRDFVPAVEKAKLRGAMVAVALFRDSFPCHALEASADRIINLDDAAILTVRPQLAEVSPSPATSSPPSSEPIATPQ